MYVDIHCHLDDPAFKDILPAVLERAQKAGVKLVISNGTSPASNLAVQELAAIYPLIRPAYGLYPTEDFDTDAALAWIREQVLSKHPAIAIGEIGLDGVKEVTDEQRIRFRKACTLAAELRLAIIVHSRKAEQAVFDELDTMRHPTPVVMHCFNGSRKLIMEGIKRNYYFSVPANINKAQHFQMLVELVPLSQLFTETDAPYLSPEKEQFPNEPKSVVSTVEHIAKIKKMTVEETRTALFMNYQRVFS